MQAATIGILGLGYVGRHLSAQYHWPSGSWATCLNSDTRPTAGTGDISSFTFDWAKSADWQKIPDIPSALVITIPPVCQTIDSEVDRLASWCQWIRANRKKTSRVVYISTTGVYPNQPGQWSETATVAPDTLKGRLRLETEKILAGHFDARIIRAGAIYGPGRHIGLRMKKKKPVPTGRQPVHRIHVIDLVRLIGLAVESNSFPPIVNAVDMEPAPTETVANWLINQKFPGYPAQMTVNSSSDYQSRKFQAASPDRFITNSLLTANLGFQFQYPTFREGLRQAVLGNARH